MKTSKIIIRIDYQKKVRLQAIARKQGRSLSNLLQQIFKDFVDSYEGSLPLVEIPKDSAE
ncbi:MAG: hypothetical protein JSU72_18500 [Deltaproteobacteria bacterium]|nr:MAG: hypothetical protein JSU72_18500 [Deltaproteobacteria bacterium]